MHLKRCHGGSKDSWGESTLVVSLGDSLGLVTALVAAVPAAEEETVAVALTWETGAVYKHVDRWSLKNTRMKATLNPVNV